MIFGGKMRDCKPQTHKTVIRHDFYESLSSLKSKVKVKKEYPVIILKPEQDGDLSGDYLKIELRENYVLFHALIDDVGNTFLLSWKEFEVFLK